jgi:hypothetical protein
MDIQQALNGQQRLLPLRNVSLLVLSLQQVQQKQQLQRSPNQNQVFKVVL